MTVLSDLQRSCGVKPVIFGRIDGINALLWPAGDKTWESVRYQLEAVLTETTPGSYLVIEDDLAGSFGTAICIDESNDLLIVSDPTKYHDYGSGAVKSGAVYVFAWSTGVLRQEILPNNAIDQINNARFGWRMAHSGDWLVIVCNPSASVVGSAYFLEAVGDTYTHRQRLTGTGATAANDFGSSAGIDGALCCVGDQLADTNGTNSGRVHVFRESSGTWSEDVAAVQDAPTTQNNQYFGHKVCISGAYIAVSAHLFDDSVADAGRAYVFEDAGVGNPLNLRATLLPVAETEAQSYFGNSLAIDGDYCAVGMPNFDVPGAPANGGRIDVFRRSGTSWQHHQGLLAPVQSSAVDAKLGHGDSCNGSVCMAGVYLVGGARGWVPSAGAYPGAAFLWKRTGTGWYQPVPVAPDGGYAVFPGVADGNFGNVVAVSSEGKIAVGAPAEEVAP